MNGGTNSIAMPYSGKMVQFYAIPAKTDSGTGRVRLKVEKPVGSTGVMIRYKTSAWVESDTRDTGTAVATITDDTAYKGVNQWYEATGLPLGQDLYFCAFPYRGNAYSSVKVENQARCRAGGLMAEWTMDSISGTTLTDTSGNGYNATISGATSVSAKVGNGLYSSAGNQTATVPNFPFTYDELSISCSFNMAHISNAPIERDIFSAHAYGYYLVFIGGGYNGNQAILSLRVGSGTNPNYTEYTASSDFIGGGGTIKHLGVTYKRNSTVKFYIDGELKQTFTSGTHYTYTGTLGLLTRDGFYYLNGWADQLRIFNRELSATEVSALYNGGAGC